MFCLIRSTTIIAYWQINFNMALSNMLNQALFLSPEIQPNFPDMISSIYTQKRPIN